MLLQYHAWGEPASRQRRIRQILATSASLQFQGKGLLPQRSDAAFLTIRVYRTSHRSTRDASAAVLVSDMNSRVGADHPVRAM
jgi:hypothetical protein